MRSVSSSEIGFTTFGLAGGEYKRAHPLNAMVGAMLGLADEQIDSMWAAAVDS